VSLGPRKGTEEKLAEPESLEDVVDTAEGLDDSVTTETQKPMKRKVANATDEIMRTMNDLTDTYEKFCKYVFFMNDMGQY
jgi:hypothetical protein